MKTTANLFNDARNSTNQFMYQMFYDVEKTCTTKMTEHSTEYQI